MNAIRVFSSNGGRRTGLMLVVAAAFVLMLPPAAPGQRVDLRERLKTLNVRVETEHYVLAGTVSDKVLEEYGRMLEYIHAEYAAGFKEVIKDAEKAEPEESREKKKAAKRRASQKKKKADKQAGERDKDEPPAATLDQKDELGRFSVLVFGTENDYQEFGQAFLGGATEHTGGMFISSLELLLILDRGNPDDSRRVLFHEAFHQFMRRYVKNPPTWLNEGLAVYYEQGVPTRKGGLRYDQPDTSYWKLCRKAIQTDCAIPLWTVIKAPQIEFYSTTRAGLPGRYKDVLKKSLYYGESYTLVHLLLSDAGGRDKLREYLRALAADDGTKTAEITREHFGPDVCAHMTPYWTRHIESRPENR